MADPLTVLIFLAALVVAIMVVVCWFDSKKYMMVNVTSTILRKWSSFDAGSISNEMMGQTGNFYYFPLELYYFEMANSDVINVSKVDYNQYKIGEEYSYEKRVKKPQAEQHS